MARCGRFIGDVEPSYVYAVLKKYLQVRRLDDIYLRLKTECS